MNPEFTLLINFIVALGLGALIGTEREVTDAGKQQRKEGIAFSGLRTYSLVSLLGFLAAYMGSQWGNFIIGILFAGIVVFLLAEYWQQSHQLKLLGITSELAAIAAFSVGVITFTSPLIATVAGVSVVVIMALKKWIRRFFQLVSEGEFLDTIKFIIIAFVVLPLLPRETIDPWGFINIHNAWLMVVFISGISFVGYILTKTIGASKGLRITGLIGGLASSTAVTTSMANQSKRNKNLVSPFTFAVIVASAVMFVRVAFEVFVLNRELLPKLAASLGIMLLVSIVALGFLGWKSSKKEHDKKSDDLELTSPFQLAPALKFGIFYIFVVILAGFANQFFGESGVYIASAFSGLADVDAITISLSNLAKSGELTAEIATKGITLAVVINTLVKLTIVQIFGSKKFFRQAALVFGIVLGSGLLAILLV